MISSCQYSFEHYEALVDSGVPIDEARQVLPNAAAVNLLMTWNARSMINLFEQRCCNRNVHEMQHFANYFRTIAMDFWPAVICQTGPQCYTGECKQGRMQCQQKIWDRGI